MRRAHERAALWLDTMPAKRLARRALAPIIEELFPADCPGCARPLPGLSRHGLCDGCWSSLEPVRSPLCPRCGIPFPRTPPADARSGLLAFPPMGDHLCRRCLRHPPAFDGARCAFEFGGPVRALVHLLKFGQRADLARPLAETAILALPEAAVFGVVIPVPLHWTRWMTRGYNQAALLARRIARATGLPYRGRALIKRRRTQDQARLDAIARRRNLRGAFAVRRREAARLAGASVLLVDDVLTTGATAEACARALRRAGARSVFVLALARAPLPGAADRVAGDPNRGGGSDRGQFLG